MYSGSAPRAGLTQTEPTALAAGVESDANQSLRPEASADGSRKKAFAPSQAGPGAAPSSELHRMIPIAPHSLPSLLGQLLPNLVFLVRDFMCARGQQFPMAHVVTATNNDMRIFG
jgi:hypothetical protein